MRQASKRVPDSAEKTVRDIRRATRRHHSAEEKIRIVLEGLRGEDRAVDRRFGNWKGESEGSCRCTERSGHDRHSRDARFIRPVESSYSSSNVWCWADKQVNRFIRKLS